MSRPSALITGGASGIGKCLVGKLAGRGYRLTVVDLAAEALLELDGRAKAQGWEVFGVCADVCNTQSMTRAFQQHVERYGSLDVAVLNAGIGEQNDFLKSPDHARWEKCLDVDLRAVLLGIKLAAKAMKGQPQGGRIISVASAAGYFPVPAAPIYAAAKSGVIHATRSLAPLLSPQGISLTTVCPQYVDTPLVQNMLRDFPDKAKALMGPLYGQPLLQPQQVVDLVLQLLQQPLPERGVQWTYEREVAGAGLAYVLLQNGAVWDPYNPKTKTLTSRGGGAGRLQGSGSSPRPRAPSASAVGVARYSPATLQAFAEATARALPASYRKVVVVGLSPSFRAATRVVQEPLPLLPRGLPAGSVLVRRLWAGVNASDINYTSGRYHGSKSAAEKALPYDAGFESVGVVIAAAPDVSSNGLLAVGQAVAAMEGGFSEYGVVAARRLLPVPSPTPEVLSLMTSGLTASIALEEVGGLKLPKSDSVAAASSSSSSSSSSKQQQQQQRKVVLVTAAAGGTGQFAVQLAKLAGCVVVGTCGGPGKASLLRKLGVDRAIDYRAEDIKAVLKAEYPGGFDLIYESVGGSMFDLAVDALAPRGTLIIIGMMSAYAAGWPRSRHEGLAEKLLWKSAAVAGFFLLKYAPLWGPHLQRLVGLVEAGQLQVALDDCPFVGLEAVADAVDRLQGGRSSGKVVVQVSRELPAAGGVAASL